MRKLGIGGEGAVYLVQHLATGQYRAAKRIPIRNPTSRVHEVHILRNLHHPSLPRIIDVLEWRENIWIVMEYISGKTLAEVRAGGVTAQQCFGVAKQLAEVLVYLHSRSCPVLHLDIKPSNIMVRKDGSLVLLDFGAALYSQNAAGKEIYLGTPGFAAPEQLSGKKLDGRADIYGYGATLYYFLYGSLPREGPEDLEHLGHRKCSGYLKLSRHLKLFRHRKLSGYLKSSGQRAGWMVRLEKIVCRCIQDDPGLRFSDSAALYQAVCRAERGYYRRRHIKMNAGAFLFLTGTIFFFRASAGWRSTSPRDMESIQKELLEKAEKTGFSQAVSCCRQAAQMEPAGSWRDILLKRITADYQFDLAEEKAVQEILYSSFLEGGNTVLEALQSEPEQYGAFAFDLGMAYWYYYLEGGGKTAAVHWLEQAVSVLDANDIQPEWGESARIHVRMGSYYEKMGKRDARGNTLADYGEYWTDLCCLLETDDPEERLPGIKQELYKELYSCLIMGANELKNSGKEREDIEKVLAKAEEFVSREEDEEIKGELTEKKAAAEAAVERVFADERGKIFDEETELSAK